MEEMEEIAQRETPVGRYRRSGREDESIAESGELSGGPGDKKM